MPKSYVEDDISVGLSDYDATRRKYGFDTITSSLSVVLDSHRLQAAASTGIGAALLGGPWVGLTSAVVVELGNFVVELAKRRHAIVEWQSSHELAYLVQLQRKFNNQEV